jgi:hypothetical protein
VEPQAVRVDAEVAVGGVLLAQAEVLPRLGGVFVDPELQGCLFGARERAPDAAGAAKEGIDALCDLAVDVRRPEHRRDLDPDLSRVH